MRNTLSIVLARMSNFWDRYKRPVKRLYQIPAIPVAFLYRRMLRRPLFIAVTGSLGKTQTKDLTGAVLTRLGRVRISPTTDNRTYDIAKNLLMTWPWTSACVQEIGAAGPSSLDIPVRVFNPRVAIITNVRSDHSAGFENRDGLVLEKSKIIREVPEDGWAILNADEPDLEVLKSQTRAQVMTYGFSELADIRALEVMSKPPLPVSLRVRTGDQVETVQTRLQGRHVAYSVLAALAVARVAGISLASAARAIESVMPLPGRMQYVRHVDGVEFILDDFKASVDSLPSVIEYIQGIQAGRTILVLGSISHETEETSAAYMRFLSQARECTDEILLVGDLACNAMPAELPPSVLMFRTTRQASEYLSPRLHTGDFVFLKGLNVYDHLRRIEIARRRPVGCWQMRCERESFCESCPFLEAEIA
jgi:UDP-N-acetylmuramoyl-tripeptide--D-alanyl-D-alanine ligase